MRTKTQALPGAFFFAWNPAFAKAAMGKVMVNINDHPDIRRAFDGLHMRELSIRYSVANRRGTPDESRELMITNYESVVVGGLF
ncbi:hypothetical protein [Rhodanobacter sp. C05]|uniref:hypothetical protein n=1 Tax=Rhodanobacter sp. C05 TaxID=1945855 RepID=UPI001C2BD71E|nr:hypothetical protein [Rhodanobacter sp. C05]